MNIEWIQEWIKRDLLYIIVIILCLGACIYVLTQVDTIDDKCNQHWIDQVNEYYPAMIDYKIYGGIYNGTIEKEERS